MTGSTQHGSLTLDQYALAGDGGNSQGGVTGKGGMASSTLKFDDTAHSLANQSAAITANVRADGGAGGDGTGASVTGGAGGSGTASLTLTGAGSVTADAQANGGGGGVNISGISGAPLGGKGGAATATANITGASVMVTANAYGGVGQTGGGAATATATGVGANGAAQSISSSSQDGKGLVTDILITSSISVAGTSTAFTHAAIGGAAPAFSTGDQGIAVETGDPATTSVTPILTANPIVAAAFATAPVYFAIDQLGGAHSSDAGADQVSSNQIEMSVNLAALPSKQDLILGLFDPTVSGNGFVSLTFDVSADGNSLIAQRFTSVGAAMTYFEDDPVDLGSLAAAPYTSSSTLSLDITFGLTTASPGDGFSVGLLVGDPPSALSVSVSRLASAMAAMGADAGRGASATHNATLDGLPTLLASPHAQV